MFRKRRPSSIRNAEAKRDRCGGPLQDRAPTLANKSPAIAAGCFSCPPSRKVAQTAANRMAFDSEIQRKLPRVGYRANLIRDQHGRFSQERYIGIGAQEGNLRLCLPKIP